MICKFTQGVLRSVLLILLQLVLNTSAADIMPPDALNYPLQSSQHPLAGTINTFLQNQASYIGDFSPTGYKHQEYLKVIESLIRSMLKYQNSSGQIVDPVKGREFQYATPCFAHAVSVVVGSGYSKDNTLQQAGVKAMDAAIKHMVDKTVPDSHYDFCTVPIMLGIQNYAKVVDAATVNRWKSDMDGIEPTIYRNGASNTGTNPNWGTINAAGEFLRYLVGMTAISYVEGKINFNLTRMSAQGLYQDNNGTLETTSLSNIDGNSFAYENVARSMLTLTAENGYAGSYAASLKNTTWKGAWTALFYQSPFGEVPAGFRSAHHIWNEAAAAINYEIWAKQYAKAGRTAEAGAFKRAAMLSLLCVKSWLRADGSGFVTKARYPLEKEWGYMSYSSHTQYNMWTASFLSTAWQFGDSTIVEKPAPSDIGGFVVPVLYGFKKVFANAGGTYVEFDVRGDHCQNATGLIRAHLKGSYPQLGPSEGYVRQADCASGTYPPLFKNSPDPSGVLSTSVGPAWQNGSTWAPLAEMQVIPLVTVLDETQSISRFKVVYTIGSGTTLHETITVEQSKITVNDSIVGGNVGSMRVYYPFLVTDGEEKTTVDLSSNQITVRLKNKGVRFSVIKPAGATLTRENKERNHRNGRCDAAYAEVSGRTAEYTLTAWPVYSPGVAVVYREPAIVRGFRLENATLRLPANSIGDYTVTVYSLQGKRIARYSQRSVSGLVNIGILCPSLAPGLYRLNVTGQGVNLNAQWVKL
jgi:hypothetical protein